VTVILAIDPGPEQSAWLVYAPGDGRFPLRSFGISPNAWLLGQLRDGISDEVTTTVIEEIASFGMPVGREVFDTVHWAGRFTEAVERGPDGRAGGRVVGLPRLKVKQAICHDSRAKDANIRQALLDRFGGAGAQGTKKAPGPLYGIAKDLWSALAIAVTYAELEP
jgi:hypothetical protein